LQNVTTQPIKHLTGRTATQRQQTHDGMAAVVPTPAAARLMKRKRSSDVLSDTTECTTDASQAEAPLDPK
jgi:hypothetical protein